MQQPDGMRVHYLCHLIIQLAWERFVVDQKDKAGITNKVWVVSVYLFVRPSIHLSVCHTVTTTSDLFDVFGLRKVPQQSRSFTYTIQRVLGRLC